MIEETAPSEDDRASFPVFRNTLHTVIVDISNSRLTWRTDFFQTAKLTRSTLSSDTRGRPALLPLKKGTPLSENADTHA
jgi:hypothetical protein